MRAYEECLSATSTQDALWCVKESARLIVLLIILVIALIGGFSGLGGRPFYGISYYGGSGLGLILIVVLILVLLGKLELSGQCLQSKFLFLSYPSSRQIQLSDISCGIFRDAEFTLWRLVPSAAVQHSDEFSSKAFRPEIIFSATRTELHALIICSAGTTRCCQFVRRPIMSSTTDKIKGMANEAAGAVKQSTGKAVGNPNLEVKGTLQKGKGEAQQAVGKAKDAVKKVIDKA